MRYTVKELGLLVDYRRSMIIRMITPLSASELITRLRSSRLLGREHTCDPARARARTLRNDRFTMESRGASRLFPAIISLDR